MCQIETCIYLTPQLEKQLHAAWYGYARPSGIKRTRKRQIQKAKFMDHGSDDGVMESLVDGKYGYCKGLKVCPFCLRPLNRED